MSSGLRQDREEYEVRIRIVAGPQVGEEYVFTAFPISIGRAVNNHLVLNETSVSAVHGNLKVKNGMLRYSHQSGTNDATVETERSPMNAGRSVLLVCVGEETVVFEGDTLRMGETTMEIDYHNVRAMQTPPTAPAPGRPL